MNFTKEQRKYMKRRLRELNGKKRKSSYLKFVLIGCLLLFGCSTFRFSYTDISAVLKTEAKLLETKLMILTASSGAFTAKVGDTKYVTAIFGCTPDKKPETPVMVEPKPKIAPQVIEKPKPKVVKAVIYSVKREGNTLVVKLNKSAIKDKNTRVRIFIGYCYYESIPGEIGKDGTVKINIDWQPPNQTKMGISVFQLTNTPDIGSGITLCSAVVLMP